MTEVRWISSLNELRALGDRHDRFVLEAGDHGLFYQIGWLERLWPAYRITPNDRLAFLRVERRGRPIGLASTQRLQVPERGFISSEPWETWEQGLISGNGTIGVRMLSRPLDDLIVFSHERLFLPERPPLMPPDAGPRLF